MKNDEEIFGYYVNWKNHTLFSSRKGFRLFTGYSWHKKIADCFRQFLHV